MNFKQLTYFITVAREGTISAAAKSLGISQPPLSTQLKLLETELGVTLFLRGGRAIHLTAAGERFYQRACTLTELACDTLRELKSQERLSKELRLGTISSCAPALLEGRLPAFLSQYPHIRFSLSEGNTFELIERLKQGLIELAVVRTPFREEEFDCCFFDEEPMAALGHPCFFPVQDGPLTLSSLTKAPLIFYRRFEHLLLAAFQEWGLTPNLFCKNDDARTTVLWANAGLGLALAPLSICRMMLGPKSILRELIEPSLYTKVAVIRPKDRPPSQAADSFFSFMTSFREA